MPKRLTVCADSDSLKRPTKKKNCTFLPAQCQVSTKLKRRKYLFVSYNIKNSNKHPCIESSHIQTSHCHKALHYAEASPSWTTLYLLSPHLTLCEIAPPGFSDLKIDAWEANWRDTIFIIFLCNLFYVFHPGFLSSANEPWERYSIDSGWCTPPREPTKCTNHLPALSFNLNTFTKSSSLWMSSVSLCFTFFFLTWLLWSQD